MPTPSPDSAGPLDAVLGRWAARRRLTEDDSARIRAAVFASPGAEPAPSGISVEPLGLEWGTAFSERLFAAVAYARVPAQAVDGVLAARRASAFTGSAIP